MEKNCSTPLKKGSALLVLLVSLVLGSLFFLFFLQLLSEKKSTALLSSSDQATEAAQSGLAAALAQLSLSTSNNPSFLVGSTNRPSDATPILLIGANNLKEPTQLIPLISGNLTLLNNYPFLSPEAIETYLQADSQRSKVDLNAKNHSIADTGSYWAPWVTMTNTLGKPIARYAYILLDEQARLNPELHQGFPRTDPINWDQGVRTMPLSLSNSLLLSPEEAEKATSLTTPIFTLEGWETIFANQESYDAKKKFLTSTSVALPDLIPASLPDGGKPKYDFNDLATNSIYGATFSDRAANIAAIIDHNFPHFKERDPSLLGCSAADQRRYLHRLAACIVDYISPEMAPTTVNGGEPSGQSLTPLITQTAERSHLLTRTSNSVTIENQYFAQVWNPYTQPIPPGSATLAVHNRQRLLFGNAAPAPFENYVQQAVMTETLRPNESTVLAFPTVVQTWVSSTNVPSHLHPHWEKGPEGNADPSHHQAFTFSWNGALVTMSRSLPVAPGLAQGGLEHDAASLSDPFNYWQCNFIPTEEDHSGHFRFVGDPRETYLSNYLWKSYSSAKSYVENTRWKGIMSDASSERLFNPVTTWIHRDFIPINPPTGNKPSSLAMTPDQVPSPYNEERDAPLAPLVLRKGPMNSIVELGNVHDPAQADDLGKAPMAGSSDDKSSIYASGGGRTLRLGQPEFFYWDTPEKRALNLIDLFTVATTNTPFASVLQSHSDNSGISSTIWRKGLININTASHEVLTALFYGITPTSDARFTNSSISTEKAEELATFLEEHRPYEKLSDLYVITPFLANAMTYIPSLSINVPGENSAAVFDRAREEGFAKMISLCTVQSRAFRVYILGQSLNATGKPLGEAMLEASVVLLPQKKETAVGASVYKTKERARLVPVVQRREWIR